MKYLKMLLLVIMTLPLSAHAQHVYTVKTVTAKPDSTSTAAKHVSLKDWCKANGVFTGLDAAFTLGTTGIGLELQTPVTKWTRLRLGFDGIPPVHVGMSFPISTYAEGKVEDNFDKIQKFMYDMTGDEMRDNVRMTGKPLMGNFKFLVDVFPFKNRHWHLTAGFFLGPKKIASALNDKDDTNSLVAMNVYNRFYNRLKEHGYDEEPVFGDIYLSPETYKELMTYGNVGVHLGDYKNGTPYYMYPAKNGTVSAKAYANAFKPYIGFGYSGAIDKEKRWNVGFEAGAMFWGGAPDVISHDGVNITKDLVNVRGKVGDYVDLMKGLAVYPAVSFKISYTIF